MDYLVNEFRGPATFIVLRYGLPLDAIKNLGFKMKPYRMRDGGDLYTPGPLGRLGVPGHGVGPDGWASSSRRAGETLLENVVAIEVDFATRNKSPRLPLRVVHGRRDPVHRERRHPRDHRRLLDPGSPSGVALHPGRRLLDRTRARSNNSWRRTGPSSRPLTDHGPWEGYNVTRHEVIPFQTTAHTLALILGMLRTGSDHMTRYLDSRGLAGRRAELFAAGREVDLLADETQVFAWTDKESRQQSRREAKAFHVQSDRVKFLGVALVAASPTGINLSGGRLRIGYRCDKGMDPVTIALKPVAAPQEAAGLIPKEIFTRFAATSGREAEIEVPLPAMPGLTQVKEVVITHEPRSRRRDRSIPDDHPARTSLP